MCEHCYEDYEKQLAELRDEMEELKKENGQLRCALIPEGNGITAGRVDHHGELELLLNVGAHAGSVYLSEGMWEAFAEAAGWDAVCTTRLVEARTAARHLLAVLNEITAGMHSDEPVFVEAAKSIVSAVSKDAAVIGSWPQEELPSLPPPCTCDHTWSLHALSGGPCNFLSCSCTAYRHPGLDLMIEDVKAHKEET